MPHTHHPRERQYKKTDLIFYKPEPHYLQSYGPQLHFKPNTEYVLKLAFDRFCPHFNDLNQGQESQWITTVEGEWQKWTKLAPAATACRLCCRALKCQGQNSPQNISHFITMPLSRLYFYVLCSAYPKVHRLAHWHICYLSSPFKHPYFYVDSNKC